MDSPITTGHNRGYYSDSCVLLLGLLTAASLLSAEHSSTAPTSPTQSRRLFIQCCRVRGGKEWGFAGKSDKALGPFVEVAALEDLGIFTGANLSDPAVAANLSLSGTQDELEDAADRLEKLDVSGFKSLEDQFRDLSEQIKADEAKAEASEERKKEQERKDKEQKAKEHQIYHELNHGTPWRGYGRWIEDGNFTKVEKAMRRHVGDDEMSASLSADEIDNPWRTEKMTYEEYEKDREERRYFPRRWSRRLQLEKLKEEGAATSFNVSQWARQFNASEFWNEELNLPTDDEEFQDNQRYNRYLKSERYGHPKVAPHHRESSVHTRGIRNNLIARSNENLTREEFEYRKIFQMLGLDEKLRRLARDKYQDEHELSRSIYKLEDDLRFYGSMSDDDAAMIRDRMEKAYHNVLNKAYREKMYLTAEKAIEADPQEALMPRRKNVEIGWLCEIWGELGKILVDMKLRDPVKAKRAFISLSFFIRKLYMKPLDLNARKIPIGHLYQMDGVFKFLSLMGFQRTQNGLGRFLVLPEEKADIFLIRTAMEHLEEALNNKYFGIETATRRIIEKEKAANPNIDMDEFDWDNSEIPGFELSDEENENPVTAHFHRLQRIEKEKEDFGLTT